MKGILWINIPRYKKSRANTLEISEREPGPLLEEDEQQYKI